MKRIISILSMVLFLASTIGAYAQSERADIRKGNRRFKEGKYSEAEVEYKRAQQKDASSYEAAYNLGNALYKQGRNEDALASYSALEKDENHPENTAAVHYNMGNAYMQSKKYDEAIECYKKSLRCNPEDMQTKFNLAYAQKMKKDEDDNKDKDNQNQNQNQNQDQNQNNQNQDQNQNQDKNQNQDQNQNQNDNKQDQQQPPQQNPDRADNERTLKAIQAADDKTKDKVDKEQAEAYGKSQGKAW